MTNGFVNYPGLTTPKGMIYTQNRGMHPDIAQVRMVPQTTPIAASGTLSFGVGTLGLQLPNCLADKAGIWIDPRGFEGTIQFLDRRWRWWRYAPVSYHFNEVGVNDQDLPYFRRNMREICEILLTDIGEESRDVSAVPTDVYPEIDVYCERPAKVLSDLLTRYGFDIVLGFSTDPVKIVQVGQGSALPGNNLMMASDENDPPTPPQFVRICFGPSVAVARFKLQAVGLDVNGELKLANALSYVPNDRDYWKYEPPFSMPNVKARFGEDSQEYQLARATVWRWYVIESFADGTLDFPDGSGSLDRITQVLPTLDHGTTFPYTLEGAVETYEKPTVHGKYLRAVQQGLWENTDFGKVDEPYEYNRYAGLVQFAKPVFLKGPDTEQTSIYPAELYLEVAFRIRDEETQQWTGYTYDHTIDPQGAGYHPISMEDRFARTFVVYEDGGNTVSAIENNRAFLDTLAQSLAVTAAGTYQKNRAVKRWYNTIMTSLRLDGLTSQVRYVVTDGDDGEPGHHTIAAQNMTFDVFSRTEAQKIRDQAIQEIILRSIPATVTYNKKGKGHA